VLRATLSHPGEGKITTNIGVIPYLLPITSGICPYLKEKKSKKEQGSEKRKTKETGK
jgi:hypothetical protein